MIELLNFIKKHKFCAVIISILTFIIPLIIVHILYSIDIGIDWLQAKWSAGEILAYIAGFEAFIGTVSLGLLALYQNHKIHEQYIESQEPLLSMSLIREKDILYLVIENNGGIQAEDINIEVLSISNNGIDNELQLDDLFKLTFQLYPKEKVKGMVAMSRKPIGTKIFPQIRLKVTYTRPDLKRKKVYERTVTYNKIFEQDSIIDSEIVIKNISNDIDKISKANVRIANYLDGHQVGKFDEINILANRSLNNDLVDAIILKQKTPIINRVQTIEESLTREDNNGQDENAHAE